MARKNYIRVKQYCEKTRIADDFILRLHDLGIIECQEIETELYIIDDDISEIERFYRLHSDLNINLEGLDALNHMLQRMQNMKMEIALLKKRLRLYE